MNRRLDYKDKRVLLQRSFFSRKTLIWVIFPLINFFYWFRLGAKESSLQARWIAEFLESEIPLTSIFNASVPGAENCPDPSQLPPPAVFQRVCPRGIPTKKALRLPPPMNGTQCALEMQAPPLLEVVDPFEFGKFKTRDLVQLNYYGYTLTMNYNPGTLCESYVNPTANRRHPCFALVRAEVEESFRRVRFDSKPNLGGRLKGPRWRNSRVPTGKMSRYQNDIVILFKQILFFSALIYCISKGVFREVPKLKGRERLQERMSQFLENLDSIDTYIRTLLRQRGRQPFDDVVVMVVNEGEIDIFYNFVCSCRAYNISLEKVLVFAGSNSVVKLIEGTGAQAAYHKSFAPVSRDASIGYLDRVFVDMMWYKAFSVWLVLRAGYNVLFQDVDLVWFRDPFPYFKAYIEEAIATSSTGQHPDGFFSDDGQRGLRYSPFFANSGFYYLLANSKTIHFAWTILTAFDTLVTSGSHQNVFTMRMMEGLWLSDFRAKLLSLEEFPTGIQFHHNPEYMKSLKAGFEKPYNFHMCWTQTKADKLKNFGDINMWYTSSKCSLKEMLRAKGPLKTLLSSFTKSKKNQVPQAVARMCCILPDPQKKWTIPSNKRKGPSFLTI
jgi:hypothetical protein